MSNCLNQRIVGPTGTWDYVQILGAKVIIKSLPISNFFGTMCSNSDLFTIEDIYFRISLDGKVITIIKLVEYPDKFFTWKDLEIVEVNVKAKFKPICGTFNCGQAICGYKVNKEASFGLGNCGVAVIDENGNIISGRFVRFVGADVEDITNDKDNVTDISFNGDEIDQ